jgi:hypothetical protein
MPTGLLEVTRTIDLSQCWPTGESGVDTVKVHLSGTNAFRFRAYPGSPAKITHAFEGAKVHGRVTKDAIDQQQRIVIPTPAIDAIELHFRPPAPELNKKQPRPSRNAALSAASTNSVSIWAIPSRE